MKALIALDVSGSVTMLALSRMRDKALRIAENSPHVSTEFAVFDHRFTPVPQMLLCSKNWFPEISNMGGGGTEIGAVLGQSQDYDVIHIMCDSYFDTTLAVPENVIIHIVEDN